MELAIYRCRGDDYLLVPKLCLPPTEAHHVFAPLQLRGDVSVDENSPTWRGILQQIDRHLFATVSASEARLLLGSDHACFHAPQEAPDALADFDAVAEYGEPSRT